MQKKKIVLGIAAAAAALTLAVSGSLMIFTDQSEVVTNVLVAGDLQIELRETIAKAQDGTHLITVAPGVEFVKDPYVKILPDSEKSVIRIRAAFSLNVDLSKLEGSEAGFTAWDVYYTALRTINEGITPAVALAKGNALNDAGAIKRDPLDSLYRPGNLAGAAYANAGWVFAADEESFSDIYNAFSSMNPKTGGVANFLVLKGYYYFVEDATLAVNYRLAVLDPTPSAGGQEAGVELRLFKNDSLTLPGIALKTAQDGSAEHINGRQADPSFGDAVDYADKHLAAADSIPADSYALNVTTGLVVDLQAQAVQYSADIFECKTFDQVMEYFNGVFN